MTELGATRLDRREAELSCEELPVNDDGDDGDSGSDEDGLELGEHNWTFRVSHDSDRPRIFARRLRLVSCDDKSESRKDSVKGEVIDGHVVTRVLR